MGKYNILICYPKCAMVIYNEIMTIRIFMGAATYFYKKDYPAQYKRIIEKKTEEKLYENIEINENILKIAEINYYLFCDIIKKIVEKEKLKGDPSL